MKNVDDMTAGELATGVNKVMKEQGITDPWEATMIFLEMPFKWGNKGGAFVKLSNTQSDGRKPSPQSSKPQSERTNSEKPQDLKSESPEP